MAAILRDSTVVVVTAVVCTQYRRAYAIPLAMITTRKSIHGFFLVSYMGMGLRLAALRAAGAPLWIIIFLIWGDCLLLRRFDYSRKQASSKETGDEHARDHGKEKEERRNDVSLPFPFPSSLTRPPRSQRERETSGNEADELIKKGFVTIYFTFELQILIY